MTSKLDNLEFRHAFVAANVKRGIAYQFRAMRNAKEMNQTQFGELTGKPQPVICRLENPNYGKVSIQTLIEMANALDVGLLVKFVPYDRLLREVQRLSQEELAPLSYEEAKANPVRTHETVQTVSSTSFKGIDFAGSVATGMRRSNNLESTKFEVVPVA